jgi:hypothetical protein
MALQGCNHATRPIPDEWSFKAVRERGTPPPDLLSDYSEGMREGVKNPKA